MGNIPGEDYEIWDSIDPCFQPGTVPRYIKVVFTGVQRCEIMGPAPPEPCILTGQDYGQWFSYYGEDPLWGHKFSWHYTGDNVTHLQTRYLGTNKYIFWGTEPGPCYNTIMNDLKVGDCSAFYIGHSGYVEIFWGPGIGP